MKSLTITEAENGYICSWKEVDMDTATEEKETIIDVQHVIEECDFEHDTMTKLLEFVAEHFGVHYDKYGSGNLRIAWDRKGSKVEDGYNAPKEIKERVRKVYSEYEKLQEEKKVSDEV